MLEDKLVRLLLSKSCKRSMNKTFSMTSMGFGQTAAAMMCYGKPPMLHNETSIAKWMLAFMADY